MHVYEHNKTVQRSSWISSTTGPRSKDRITTMQLAHGELADSATANNRHTRKLGNKSLALVRIKSGLKEPVGSQTLQWKSDHHHHSSSEAVTPWLLPSSTLPICHSLQVSMWHNLLPPHSRWCQSAVQGITEWKGSSLLQPTLTSSDPLLTDTHTTYFQNTQFNNFLSMTPPTLSSDLLTSHPPSNSSVLTWFH